MMRYLHLILLVSLLAGCFGGGEVVPQDRFYHLADISGDVMQVSKPFGVIAVAPLKSNVLHHERTILYSLQSSPLMLNTYYYHQWDNVPGEMIQEHLIAYLRAVGFADTVVRYGEREQVDGQINGYIQRFERIVGNGLPKVVVRLELSFRTRTPGAQRSLTKVYSDEREAADNSMEATVAAFSQALQTIYGRFVADIMH
jgi:ABC-type uncharacterized transport system auxiliary subunit